MAPRKIRQIERLLMILNLLTERETITAKELAHYCGTSTRSIYRDMRTLESIGVMFISEGKEGYKLIQKPAQPHRLFSEEELLALTVYPALLGSTQALQDQKGMNAYKKGIEKLKALTITGTNEKLIKVSSHLGKRILIHDQAESNFSNHIMPSLLRAVFENKALEVDYYAISRDESSRRVIHPYYILPRSGHLYVIAKCLLRKDIRIFRVDRIATATLLDKTFSIPRNFDINDYLSNRWSIFADDKRPTTLTVKFKSLASRYIKEQQFYTETELTEHDDGTILLKATVQSKKEFIRWIRSFGLDAEILEPEEVRQQLVDEYFRQFEKYKK
ncbi:transcriptional regulator [Alkalihalobacillus oceani]|uniref:helix-turn-helix transcriptional regulator n=1 Tax=Halalkalibacter oceani TaxID=1653776 RepID=UPI00203C21EA|nr:transcriptional regulator [Halalkalibacter oceani]MCM3761172.1 transcriptional regulator [Halalkalibacter oceani]